ncbi:T6SS immunity protein Tli3 family protein [Burkholderia ubonensis]|uniref:T6SS immunity protein Tli3 family protein n=1 Tax=Burkholderia ubonensis TaxID=101571 RepID=UPI00211B7A8A|nr:hypothetical protein [Burkholderia ubonensis]
MVYRIDDYRYISIRSPQKCNGHLDGNIYYNDTRSGVRTFVSFTGPMRNGLYRGYYAIQSNSNNIAIPSLAFSQTSGMFMRIYYSHDGGRTFHWFKAGVDDKNNALILIEGLLYWTRMNLSNQSEYANEGASVYDIERDMGKTFAHYDPVTTFEKYGKSVSRSQIPLNMKSPSGETHWSCPANTEKK